MLKVSLVNMPFVTLQFPSIALTQLKSVAESRFDELETRILADTDSSGWRLQDIAGHVEAEAASVATKIERLRGLGLFFEEGERLISVVLLAGDSASEEEGRFATAGTTAFSSLAARV